MNDLCAKLLDNDMDKALLRLYPHHQLAAQKERYSSILDSFHKEFGEGTPAFFSAPGRTEVGGNHTDHNHGRVLAAGINLDAVAAAVPREGTVIREKSAGHALNVVDIASLAPVPQEIGHSSALIRGVCAGFVQRGYTIGAFDAAVCSDVLSGSGLSSSAAYEVLIGTVLNYLYNDGKVSAVEIAQIAQFAENVYFGKPCGLMDQMASSVSGFVTIDFADPSEPVIEKVDFDFAACGHSLCIVNTGGSHNDLTDDYAAVRGEMETVAAVFGKKVLRDVEPEEFYASLAQVRSQVSDRAIIRAMHFFNENLRVEKEVDALTKGDFEAFKQTVIDSGYSSYMYNQNVFTTKQPTDQPVSLALALSAEILKGKGAWRVHGGGFAGTIQAFVPDELLETYKSQMEAVFGEGSCMVLQIRPYGGVRV
ncbi:MAG: galactokinase family protein [Oscillospiraceae bacterium]|nr:galactokinase family protein [Oscillospiraceae bacterium]